MYKTAPWEHFKTITIHKWYVFKNCCKIGMPIRGLLHDMSKYSPIEFGESMRYYTGNRSPIDNCKDATGMSRAWLHHKGRNPHHWEYWIDDIGNGGEGHPVAKLMPYKYAAEMICDYLAAGQAYERKNWTPQSEWQWWIKKRESCLMHPVIMRFVDLSLGYIKECPNWKDYVNKYSIRAAYDMALEDYNNGILD